LKVGGTAFSCLNDFLKEKLDAVYICTPPNTHAKLIQRVANKNFAIFVEKPLDTNVKRAEEIVKLVERKRIINQIGFNFRFASNVLKVKELARKMKLKFRFFHASWLGSLPQLPKWWKSYRITGGMINEQTSHLFDLIRFVVGEVNEVFCERKRLFYKLNNFTNEDTIIAILKLQDGSYGSIVASCGAHFTRSLGFAEYIPFWHTQYIGCVFLTKELTFELLGTSKLILNDGRRRIEYENFRSTYLEEDRAFLNSILKNKESPVPFREGLKTLYVIDAAKKSSKVRKFVKVRKSD